MSFNSVLADCVDIAIKDKEIFRRDAVAHFAERVLARTRPAHFVSHISNAMRKASVYQICPTPLYYQTRVDVITNHTVYVYCCRCERACRLAGVGNMRDFLATQPALSVRTVCIAIAAIYRRYLIIRYDLTPPSE